MDFVTAPTLPWLDEAQQRVRSAWAAGRLPHALLVLSKPGLGAERFADWCAGLVLCQATAARPCGECPACTLLKSDSHPDLHVVRLEEDAQQIKVDQVRELIEALTFKSYRGGYKVGIIESAEQLNTNGANAFLKTLEEPGANTLLIMVSRPSHRLPATIASRCTRVALRPPPVADALAWLGQRAPDTSWDAALTLAGGAPLRALELAALGMPELDADMRAVLAQLAAGSVDVTLLAEHWLKFDLGLRLAWLENWITRRIQAALAGDVSQQSAEPVRLPAALLKPKIRALFDLLDASRDLRRLGTTSMNQQLALEAMLVGGQAALAR
jgi:DNA polymerase-3 subunit delta'